MTIRIPSVQEDSSRGQVTDRSQKTLGPSEYKLLQNTFPGHSNKPRNGVSDKVFKQDQLGYGTDHTFFQQRPLYVNKGGKDFFFIWSRNLTDTSQHLLEVWNATDGTRTKLVYGDFPQSDVYFQMIKLYDAIYCVMEYEMTTNHVSAYRTKNMVIEWSTATSAWTVREMAVDVAPTMPELEQIEGVYAGLPKAIASQGVLVYNNKLFSFNGTDLASVTRAVTSTDDMVRWSVETSEASYGTNYCKTPVSYNGKMWIVSGSSAGAVYSSTDGRTWTTVVSGLAVLQKTGHTVLVYKGLMWLIGGQYSGTYSDDVYYSSDGVTWTLATGSAAFGTITGHTSVVFNNKMWVIGGDDNGTYQDDVYYSTDGVTWTLATGSAAFGLRASHSSVVYNGKMWVIGGIIGGTYQADVYYSADGATWTSATAAAAFGGLANFGAAVYLGKMWVVGGQSAFSAITDAVYYSTDGVTWTRQALAETVGKHIRYGFQFVRREDAVLAAIAGYKMHNWVTGIGRTNPGPDEKLLSGTISYNGSSRAITGVGTAFDTQLVVGDRIRPSGDSMYITIATITNSTTATGVERGKSYTAVEYSRLPAVGEYVASSDYLPGDQFGVYDRATDQVVSVQGAGAYSLIGVELPVVDDAKAQGATHLRLYKTLESGSIDTLAGLPLLYVVDIPVASNNYDATAFYWDVTTDAEIQGETNTLDAAGFDVPPMGRYSVWAGGRQWIQKTDKPGYWYASTTPLNTRYPEKYASMFNLDTDYVTCDPDDNQKDSGGIVLGGDLYFFKERKIFVLDNADLANTPRDVSKSIGCVCPETLTYGDFPALGGESVLFLSGEGPAQLLPGGSVRLLKEFTLEEVWPGGEVLKISNGDPTDWYTRNKVTACWYENKWFLFYGDSRDTNCQITTHKTKILYANPQTGVVAPCEAVWNGDGLDATPTVARRVYEPLCMVVKGDVEAYTFSHCKRESENSICYRLTRMMKPGLFLDTYLSEGGWTAASMAMVMGLKTRFLWADNGSWYQKVEIRKLITHMAFDDTGTLIIYVRANGGKQTIACTWSQVRQSGLTVDNSYRHKIEVVSPEGFIGDFFEIEIQKDVPSTGALEYFWSQLIGEGIDIEEEYTDGAGAATGNVTFVVTADTSPEVNAYA